MIVKSKTPIRKFGGTIIGWLESDKDGNQQVRDFSGKILGKYDKRLDCTRDFYGTKIATGNQILLLLQDKLK